MTNLFTILLVALGITQFLDAYTTLKALGLGAREANPVLSYLFSKFSAKGVLALKAMLIVFLAFKAGEPNIIGVGIVTLVYTGVVIWNFKKLKQLQG